MGSGAARFVCVVGAIAGATGFIVVTPRLRIATIGASFAMNAIIALLPTKAAALVAVLLKSIGGRAEGVRRGAHDVSEPALKTTLSHLQPFGKSIRFRASKQQNCKLSEYY